MNRNTFFRGALVLIMLIGLTVSLAPPGRTLATPAAGGCWYYKADMPEPSHGMAAVELNDQIYVMGGQNGNVLNLLERYDPSGNTWETLKSMPTARTWLSAAVASPEPGKPQIYAIGGADLPIKYDVVEMYDPGTNTWTSKAPMINARFGAVTGVVNNKIYVIGGFRGGTLSDVEEYDPVLNTWTIKAPLPAPVAMAAGAVVADKIYVFGGINDTEVLDTVYEYTPATNTWAQKGDIPLPGPDITFAGRNRLAAAAVGDNIYVIGGINPQNRWLDTVQSYTPAGDSWMTMNWMPNERGEIAAAGLDDMIYVFGGRRSWDSEVVAYNQAFNVACTNDPPNDPADPDPIPGRTNQPVDLQLSWSGGDPDGTATYDVYFSETWEPTQSTTPPLVSGDQAGTTYQPPATLKPGIKYYWRIVAQDDTGAVTAGDLWGFWTGAGPYIEVDKQAEPEFLPEAGGTVTYTVTVTNSGNQAVTLTDLDDDPHGDITATSGSIDSTTCTLPQALAPEASYSCYFTATESGTIGDILTDLVTATAHNSEMVIARAQDSATVEIISNEPNVRVTKTADPLTVPETGGTVDYGVKVQNFGFVPLTLSELNDDIFGDLETVEGSTCSLPVPLASGEIYECGFSALITGDAGLEHTNTVTATATYEGDNFVTGSGSATVKFTDELPIASVTKWGNPNVVAEPGGDVEYTITVANSGVETIYLASLNDDVFGDLNGKGDCEITETGPVLMEGETYQCSFTEAVTGLEGDEHTNTVTAAVYDDENNIVYKSDSFTVRFTDELPAISVTYAADPNPVAPGGVVTFTVQVTNDNVIDEVDLIDLSDSVFGDLKTDCDLATPASIPAGDSWTCDFQRTLTEDHASTVTATAEDSENNTATATADVKVQVGFKIYFPLIPKNNP